MGNASYWNQTGKPILNWYHLHNTHLPQSLYMIQWSSSGSVMFASVIFQGYSRELCCLIVENPECKTAPTWSIFVLQFPINFLIYEMFFVDQRLCWTWMKFLVLVLVSSSTDRKSYMHKANMGHLPSTANRTPSKGVENSSGPPTHHIQMGLMHAASTTPCPTAVRGKSEGRLMDGRSCLSFRCGGY